jgi:uncharacterized protein YggE
MKKIIGSSLVLMACFLYFLQNSHAHDSSACKEDQRTISIAGEASVNAAPDMAVVDFTIETQDMTFRKARERNAEISAKVLNGIRKIKLSEKNINLKNLNVNEWREYDHKQRKSIFKGYKANRNFQVRVYKRDLSANETLSEKIAQVVNVASESGITRLGSVNYSIEDTKELKNKALSEAVVNAKEKANIMLTGLGAKLGKVKSVSENTYSPRPYVKNYARMAVAMDAESSAMPEPDAYAEGDMTITSKVNITFFIQ